MLCSPDATAKKVADTTLGQAVSKRLNKVVSRRKHADFLTGEMAMCRSMAQTVSRAKVRSATAKLKTML